MRPYEVLKFDLGFGPNLFMNDLPAVFKATIRYKSLDDREFSSDHTLAVESVSGHSRWQVYGIDDVARRLKDISDTLETFTRYKGLRVETYDADDRREERKEQEERRERLRQQQSSEIGTTVGNG